MFLSVLCGLLLPFLTSENARTMKRVLTAVVLIPIVLLIVFRGSTWLFGSVVALIAILGLLEFANLVRGHGYEFDHGVVVFLALLFFALRLLYPTFAEWNLIFVMLVAVLLMAIALGRTDLRQVLPSAAAGMLAFVYIAATLMALVDLRVRAWGKFLLLYVFVVVWSGDTFAYYTGRAIGRHKLAPSISPGKTWEGTVASTVGSTILGVLMFAFSQSIAGFLVNMRLLYPAEISNPAWLAPPLWAAILVSAVINISAQIGDLVESAIKRGANVKDSGNLLPGHGGILDRIDALLFAAPVGLVLIQVILPNRP